MCATTASRNSRVLFYTDSLRSRHKTVASASVARKGNFYQAQDGRVSLCYGETRLEHVAVPRGDIFMLPLG